MVFFWGKLEQVEQILKQGEPRERSSDCPLHCSLLHHRCLPGNLSSTQMWNVMIRKAEKVSFIFGDKGGRGGE